MQSSFTVKRKARRVGQDETDESNGKISLGGDVEEAVGMSCDGPRLRFSDSQNLYRLTICSELTPVVTRPALSARGSSSKSKKRSSLRVSFGPGGTSMNDDENEIPSSVVFTPKRSNLNRQVTEKNALRKSLVSSIPPTKAPSRHDEDRPSYTADMLDELRASTPSTPKDLRSQSGSPSGGKEIDMAAKFGSDLAIQREIAIPTDAEIKEKKERRARIAKEQEYISLNSDGEPDDDGRDDSDSDASSTHENSVLPYTGPRRLKEPASRLQQDDEEVGEGFDDFVSDGHIALSKKAEREQRRWQKAEMKTMIEKAEGSDDSSENESEVERRAAYEAAQTRKGMDGLKKHDEGARPRRPRTPPRITPLPTLGGILERLRERQQGRQYEKKIQQARLDTVRKELADIEVRKVEVQRLMTEAGERFEKLQAEVQAEKGGVEAGDLVMAEKSDLSMGFGVRGLESIGTN